MTYCPTNLARRRRKTLRVLKRTLPKVFSCPKCGMASIRITSQMDEASQDYVTVVACGTCKNPPTRREYRFTTEREEIDVYNMFVDDFVKSGG